jgi:FkbM family methyltransferase
MLFFDKLGLTRNFRISTKFDKDIRINLSLDDWIQKQIFYFGRYEIEKNETLFWQNIVCGNNTVLDIGANIGYYTLMAAARISDESRVYGFEPVSDTYRKLLENIKINDFKNIISENLAVSNENGEIELFVADEKSTGSSSIALHVNFSGSKEKVKTIKIDDYLSQKSIKKVDLVKIDVEGCEPWVIEGMKETMRNLKPVIMIEVLDERLNTVNSSKEQLFELFSENNYSAYEIAGALTLSKIDSPKEGGLIVFKHKETVFPKKIIVN